MLLKVTKRQASVYPRQTPGLTFFDSHNAATAPNLNRHIISTDKAYDTVPGLTRTHPNEYLSPTIECMSMRRHPAGGHPRGVKSDENIEWMLRNGYIKEKRNKRGARRKR